MDSEKSRREDGVFQQNSPTEPDGRSSTDDRLKSRRRFLKIGLGTAPVVFTLAARPARATVTITGGDGYGEYGYGNNGGDITFGHDQLEEAQTDPTSPRPDDSGSIQDLQRTD
jgi:hypothetical protein